MCLGWVQLQNTDNRRITIRIGTINNIGNFTGSEHPVPRCDHWNINLFASCWSIQPESLTRFNRCAWSIELGIYAPGDKCLSFICRSLNFGHSRWWCTSHNSDLCVRNCRRQVRKSNVHIQIKVHFINWKNYFFLQGERHTWIHADFGLQFWCTVWLYFLHIFGLLWPDQSTHYVANIFPDFLHIFPRNTGIFDKNRSKTRK